MHVRERPVHSHKQLSVDDQLSYKGILGTRSHTMGAASCIQNAKGMWYTHSHSHTCAALRWCPRAKHKVLLVECQQRKTGVAYLHITPLLKQRLSWNYIYMTRTYKRGNFRYGFPSGSTICQVINASTQVLCCTASLHP